MTDDWSLKQVEKTAEWGLDKKDRKYYYDEDIETLRLKLIEDLRAWVKNFNNEAGDYTECPQLGDGRFFDKIVNHRFGVTP